MNKPLRKKRIRRGNKCRWKGCNRLDNEHGASRGYCQTHYNRWLAGGDMDAPMPIRKQKPKIKRCEQEGCEREAVSPYGKFCCAHRDRKRDGRDMCAPIRIRSKNHYWKGKRCMMAGCDEPVYAHGNAGGLCNMHYYRKRNGRPLEDADKRINGGIYKIQLRTASMRRKYPRMLYIGQTIYPFKSRLAGHRSSYKTEWGTHPKLHAAFDEVGIDAFELLALEENIKTYKELNRLERKYIRELDTYHNGLNSTRGGAGAITRPAGYFTEQKEYKIQFTTRKDPLSMFIDSPSMLSTTRKDPLSMFIDSPSMLSTTSQEVYYA